ncbi:MAG: serine acetyltransferase [Ruminococcaceae bacterium]|nr:serine acetyltransferase [Oscillospiraceae bacterium]
MMKNNSKKNLDTAMSEILAGYREGALPIREALSPMPSKQEIIEIIWNLHRVLFPGFFEKGEDSVLKSEDALDLLLYETYYRLKRQIMLAFSFFAPEKPFSDFEEQAEAVCDAFFTKLPHIQIMLGKDVNAGFLGDPAAQSKEEIVICYPGFYAISVYRFAHELYTAKVPLLPRIMTEHAHSLTGIDINAGAVIGENFFIDHGTGIVIGETCVIGKNVKVYQGVTLGALSTRGGQSLAGVRRHPTVEDNVTIYAGATILGGETVIGENSVIGGNCFVTKPIPPNTKVFAATQELTLKPSNINKE